MQATLQAGKGNLIRDTESGQILLNLNQYADVAEYVHWINSFSEDVYKTVWGDKETWAVAFAVAGKAHEFMQLAVSGCRKDAPLMSASGKDRR